VVVATTTTVYRYRIGMEIFIEDDGNENVQGTHIQICITTRIIK
jgi:hypothetical protein